LARKPTLPSTPIVHTGRRRFLKTGVAGAALLVATRWATPASTADAANAGSRFNFLTADDAGLLRRIAPVMLEGALPPEDGARKSALDDVLAGVDVTVSYQPPTVRQEIRDLFNLLENSATRAVVAGVWTSWDRATDQTIREFLASWHDSRFDLLRTAYIGLNNLIVGSWYANPKSWARIGYGGPPKIAPPKIA
jgi:hypothetical protein